MWYDPNDSHFFVFSVVLDVQLSFNRTVEEAFKDSLKAMTTKGEWELVDMLAEKPTIPPQEMNISRDMLTYYVLSF